MNTANSEFWRLCHDLDPFDTPSLSKNAREKLISLASQMVDESGSGDAESDDSLQNLFVKKERETAAFIANHGNRINTQRIIDTIELIADDSDIDSIECNEKSALVKANDVEKKIKRVTFALIDDDNEISDAWPSHHNHNNDDDDGSDGFESIDNADDLLLKIADNLKHLKENVNEIDAHTSETMKGDTIGDLIDFGESVEQFQMDKHTGESKSNEKQLLRFVAHFMLFFTFLSAMHSFVSRWLWPFIVK